MDPQDRNEAVIQRLQETIDAIKTGRWPDGWESMWAPVDKVEVKFLGSADPSVEAGVVCASFNAG